MEASYSKSRSCTTDSHIAASVLLLADFTQSYQLVVSTTGGGVGGMSSVSWEKSMIGISSASPCCPVAAGAAHGSMRSRECPVLLSPLLDGVGRLFSSLVTTPYYEIVANRHIKSKEKAWKEER